MKLYWSPRSPFVRKVMVCAHELGIAERIEKVYTFVAMHQVNDDMLGVNPIGRIPALVTDEGRVLYDSHVICEYLDAVNGGPRLVPQGPGRWEALRRHALGDGMLENGILWRAERQRPAEQQSAAIIRAFGQKIAGGLAAVEREASTLATDEPLLGEIAIGCALGYLDFRLAELEWRAHHPQAAKWFETFNSRASMRETHPYEER